jgi:hypothetical protein
VTPRTAAAATALSTPSPHLGSIFINGVNINGHRNLQRKKKDLSQVRKSAE